MLGGGCSLPRCGQILYLERCPLLLRGEGGALVAETPEIRIKPAEASTTMAAASQELQDASLRRPDSSGLDSRLASSMCNQFDATHKHVTAAGATMSAGAEHARAVGRTDEADAKDLERIRQQAKMAAHHVSGRSELSQLAGVGRVEGQSPVPLSFGSLPGGPPPTSIVWCRESGSGFMCRELLNDGTIAIYSSPVDLSGGWP